MEILPSPRPPRGYDAISNPALPIREEVNRAPAWLLLSLRERKPYERQVRACWPLRVRLAREPSKHFLPEPSDPQRWDGRGLADCGLDRPRPHSANRE